MAVALVLLAVVGGNVYSLLKQSSSSLGTKQSSADLDTQARRTMDRIAMALIGATADGLVLPPEQPNSTPSLNYRTNLGMQDGAMTFSDPMRIEFMNSIVSWYENPNAPNENEGRARVPRRRDRQRNRRQRERHPRRDGPRVREEREEHHDLPLRATDDVGRTGRVEEPQRDGHLQELTT
jgi:hypothetical protein